MIHNILSLWQKNQTVVLKAFTVSHFLDSLINFRPEFLVSEADFLYLQIVVIIFFFLGEHNLTAISKHGP